MFSDLLRLLNQPDSIDLTVNFSRVGGMACGLHLSQAKFETNRRMDMKTKTNIKAGRAHIIVVC